MATLFERLAGIKANGDLPEEGKVPLHVFTAIMREFKDGRVTGAEAQAMLGLTPANVQDVQWLFQALAECSNKNDFLRLMKDHLYLAEWRSTQSAFAVESEFWSKLSQEVTDQGGNPPAR